MPSISKRLLGFIKFQFNHLITGGKGEAARIHEYYSLKTVELKNKKLATELENACKKNNGVLTFAEYLTIDQFGEHGYHVNNKYHGEQPNYEFPAETLIKYCINNNISNVIDFGPGNGDLDIYALKYGKKLNKIFTWNGIEINKDLRTIIEERFRREKLTPQLRKIVSAIDELSINQKSAVVFSYSLDNLAPEMLINTTKLFSYPTAVLGVVISQNNLREVILTDAQLQKKRIKLKNGIFTDCKNQTFDLTAWKLSPFQRACIPLSAATILASLTKRLPNGSIVLIIDEFNRDPYFAHAKHLNIPKDLTAYHRYFENLNDLYKTSGNNLLYSPTYADCYLKALKSLGYSNIPVDLKSKKANKLRLSKLAETSSNYSLMLARIKKRPIRFPVVLGAYRR